MVLTLIGLRPDLEPIRDQILGSSSVPSLDDVLLASSEDAVVPEVEANVLIAPIAINLATLAIVAISYMEDLLALPIWPSPLILRCLSLRASASQTSQASIASVAQPGNASACLTHTSSLGPWILDSGASDHLSGNKDLFSSITTTSDLPTVTLANGSQTVAKGPEYGKTIGIGRESQGLYHLTSDSSPAVCISTDAPLLIHNRLGHPSLSKFQKMVPRFSTLSSLPCESCQLGKHTRVSFPKRLNNRAKSPFELVTLMFGVLVGLQIYTENPNPVQYFYSCVYAVTMPGNIFSPIYFVYVSSWDSSSVFLCSYSSTKWVAERKNRHLVETARTLLLHIMDKLSAKAMKCLFLGYSKLQKGYRCYSLETHRYFISADVTFFEDSPFFSTTSESLPVSEVLPIPIVSPPDVMPPRPLQVYHRRLVSLLLSLFLRHLLTHFLSLRLHLPRLCLLLMTYLLLFGKSTHEALSHPGWRQAMVDEMAALHSNGTWDLLFYPLVNLQLVVVGSMQLRLVLMVQVDRLKARLVAKGYTQVYGSDYGDTFSPVAKIASVRLLLSMAAMCSWPLYQLDIKNAFLHGDLAEEVYMEQPPGFVAQGESGLVCRLRRSLYGLKQSPRAWFSRFSSVVQEFGMLRSSDQDGIQKLKQHLFTHFQTKDLGKLKYFLGIEIAQSSSGVVLSQRKYALDILEETGMLDCKPVDTPMDPNVKLAPGQGEPLGDPGRYRRLVGKLNYLTITRPDISFPVSVVSQFLQSPCDSHWDAVIRILRYIKSTPGQGVLYENRGHTQVVGYTDADWAGSPTDRRSTSGYCVFIGGNLISWKSKKQDVVARSSAEAEYRAMALATCELIWLRHLLQELRFGKDEQMKLICDNQAALHIASNPVFHERTKHIEVDCHFIREKIASGCVATSFVNSNDQLADIFTKSLRGPRIKYICNKLGAYDVYAPA
ncbi:Retrovirus-related Pol polyprotein from transposon RE1 [Vitis vinifera]|uniref:Retrovirus-related Pol polyprotein from transposon RE1 n=1 Tax=Vitis vinifera TaxID=29760 RepID=A0A438HH83_VITVI|nr:Retrovirus-related Pol polyprotein from transposon RE1 [Vitis vinifera]